VHNTIAEIATLANHCARAGSLHGLAGHIEAAIRDIGFRWFSLTNMVDLQKDDQNGVIIQDYPTSWFDEIVEKRLFEDSAILTAAAKSFGGICWSKIYERFPPNHRQRETLRRSRDHGLNSGFTIAMPMVGAPNAAFTVARSKPDEVSEQEKVAVRAIAMIALEHGRRIAALNVPPRAPSLTARQRQCTALVAQGKTDWEIGTIIGISRDTVHEYIETARKKYDVRTRPQLVLAAFRNGELSDLDLGISS
jgi:DNA-binding CsgD family transcriptional regulator